MIIEHESSDKRHLYDDLYKHVGSEMFCFTCDFILQLEGDPWSVDKSGEAEGGVGNIKTVLVSFVFQFLPTRPPTS